VTNKKYYFSGWEFDCHQDTIKHCDQPNTKKLEPQLSALLCLLIENKDRVLSKVQLSEALWPNTVVEENSLYQILTKLRKNLSDPPKQSSIIKTFPKKGYQFIANLEEIDNSTKVNKNELRESIRRTKTTIWLVALFVAFSAIAYLSTKQTQPSKTNYASSELTTELGLESWPTPHPSNGSFAYVKDEHQLLQRDSRNNTSLLVTSKDRLFYPVWSNDGDQIAFWQFDGNNCQLSILDISSKKQLTSSKSCDFLERIVWVNKDQLIVLFRHQGDYSPYQYNIASDTFTKIPLLLNKDEHLKTAVKAWKNDIYYVAIDTEYNSRLMNSNGNTLIRWPHPVKFAAFDLQNQRLIINDKSKHLGLKSVDIDGSSQQISQTTRGIFSSIATGTNGTIYATAENWQVNIRDKDNLPIFSSTSLDYLPVSNSLGETAFMSRRGGFCQIYLYKNEEVQQLSYFDNYDTVKFVQWSLDLQFILTNRDNSAYIYNRQGLAYSFPLTTDGLPTSFGWLTDNKIFSYDGVFLRYYHISGEKVAEFKIIADYLYYQPEQQTWWLFKDDTIYSANSELLNIEHIEAKISLSKNQSVNISGTRIIENQLYWKSRYQNQDHIWRYSMETSKAELLKSGRFIWNYDVNEKHEITTAIKENIEGNIYLFTKE